MLSSLSYERDTSKQKLKMYQEKYKNLCFLIHKFMVIQMLSVCNKLKMNVSIFFFDLSSLQYDLFAFGRKKSLYASWKYRLEMSRNVIIGPISFKCSNMQLIKK